jgi:CcmD family protein
MIAAGAVPLVAQVSQPAQQQGDFVPVKDLPGVQQEHLPAAPLVMIAYAFVWVALLVYVWSLWRRVGTVQRELTDLRRRVERKA